MCFFSLFSVGAAALAWFCCNKSVSGSGTSVNPKIEDLHADYFVYKYSKNNVGTELDESTENATDKLSVTGFTLNTYDTIFTQQNAFTPALVRIHLYGRDLPDVAAGESQAITVRIARNTSFVDETADDANDLSTYKCITSVADFTVKEATNYSSYIQNNDLDDIRNIPDFFQAVVTSFKEGSETPVNFINETDATTKTNSIGLQTTYSNVVQKDGVNHVIIYLYIDYNLDLINNFTGTASQNLSSDFLTAVDTILENDLTSISVELGNK